MQPVTEGHKLYTIEKFTELAQWLYDQSHQLVSYEGLSLNLGPDLNEM